MNNTMGRQDSKQLLGAIIGDERLKDEFFGIANSHRNLRRKSYDSDHSFSYTIYVSDNP